MHLECRERCQARVLASDESSDAYASRHKAPCVTQGLQSNLDCMYYVTCSANAIASGLQLAGLWRILLVSNASASGSRRVPTDGRQSGWQLVKRAG